MAKGKANTNQVLMNAGMAFGGGVLAEVVSDLVAQNAPDLIQSNPKLTEIIPGGLGVGLLFFMPGKFDPLAYGMIGASGAGLSDDIIGGMQGFNRMTLQGDADNYRRGREYVEELINEGFKSNPMNGTDEEGCFDGMSNC
jgi:hypothetical protein